MQPRQDPSNASQESGFSLTALERVHSRVNSWRLALRNRVAFSRSGYREAGLEGKSWQNWLTQWDEVTQEQIFVLEKKFGFHEWRDSLGLLSYTKNLNTLWVLEKLLDGEKLTHSPLLVSEAACHDFVRAPAITNYLQRKVRQHYLTGIELDAFPVLQNLHSRLDKAQYYISRIPSAQYLAQDFFHSHQSAHLIVAFYPFVSPHPSLAWGLPSYFGNAKRWIQALEQNLVRGGLALVVHQGSWEEEEFAQALQEAQRDGSRLGLLKQSPVNCPFYPTRFPALGSVYRKE